MTADAGETRLFADEIASYLDERPEAVDTSEGILRWWLPACHRDATAERVERALDLLIAEGVVEQRMLPDGGRVYARAGRRRGPRA